MKRVHGRERCTAAHGKRMYSSGVIGMAGDGAEYEGPADESVLRVRA